MEFDPDRIRENAEALGKRIQAAARECGRNPSDIRVLAVTKFQPEEAVREAYSLGFRLFGENRVQEAEEKYSAAARDAIPGVRLDLIGHLQSNKINKAMRIFDTIQSIDSIELLEAVLRKSSGETAVKRILLEVRTGEDSKSGFDTLDQLLAAVEVYFTFTQSHAGESHPLPALSGLMTMAPFTDDRSLQRAAFSKTAGFMREIASRFRLPDFSELSMGMSGDFEAAILEGSTLIRIGTALFGARD